MQIMIDNMRQSHAFHSQFPIIIRKMFWCIVLIFISNVTAIKHAVSYPRWWAMDAVHCPTRSAVLMVCENIKSKSIQTCLLYYCIIYLIMSLNKTFIALGRLTLLSYWQCLWCRKWNLSEWGEFKGMIKRKLLSVTANFINF